MESSPEGRTGEIGEHIAIIVVTAIQLIFLTFYHRLISWPVTGADGTVTRLSMLTADYATWLPFPITASILVIVASIVMILYDRYWFHRTVWIIFCLIGLTIVLSLLTIFPFDFSVLPTETAADLVPKVLTAFLVFMAVFYAGSAVVLFVQLLRHRATKDAG